MDPVGAVAIREKKTAVRQKGVVGRHEGVAAPAFRWFGVLVFWINAGIHRRPLFPNLLSLESELGEILQLLVTGDVKELFVAFGADFQTMTAALELITESADEFPVLVENKNGGVILEVLAPFMDDVEEAFAVDGDVVRDLPGVFGRKLRPVMEYFVAVIT